MYIGAAYYPEQEKKEKVRENAILMQKAGLNVVRMGEFAWSYLERPDGEFNLGWLQDTVEELAQYGISSILCTPTAAPPKWVMDRYPDIYQIYEDGQRREFGRRRHACVNNENYRFCTAQIVRKIAETFKDNENVIGYQLDNELMSEKPYCYCQTCRKKYQEWLRKKYHDIHTLNESWGTIFWSQTYYGFDEIEIPYPDQNPAALMDYFSFASDSYISYAKYQADLIREISPGKQITTNICSSGFLYRLNLYRLSEILDFCSIDNYPYSWGFETEYGFPDRFTYHPAVAAMALAQTRALKDGSFYVMEAQIGSTAGRQRYLINPGCLTLWRNQEVLHGARGIICFPWKQFAYGREHISQGIISVEGKTGQIYEEIEKAARDLREISGLIGSGCYKAEAGIVRDFFSDWGFEAGRYHDDFRYMRHLFRYYKELFEKKVPADLIDIDQDFSKYKLIILSSVLIMNEKRAKSVKSFVENGGIVILTAFSGLKDEWMRTPQKGCPYLLEDVVGASIESRQTLPESERIRISKGFHAEVDFDVLTLSTAEPLLVYEETFLKGKAVITGNSYGKGYVYYVGTVADEQLTEFVVGLAMKKAGIEPVVDCKDAWLEAAKIENREDTYIYLINHSDKEVKVKADGKMQDAILQEGVNSEFLMKPESIKLLRKIGK